MPSEGNICLIVAPHPDDETIGAGIWMDRHRDARIFVLHVTDGSPRDLSNARVAGYHSRRAYAAARRREVYQALKYVGIGRHQCRVFSYIDKESWLHLPELVARMATLIDQIRPTLILSPAYEGGHPDHDSVALAVHFARCHLSRPFLHREYTLYHAGRDGAIVTGEFLSHPDIPVEVLALSDAEQDRKRRMLASFVTQRDILMQFSVIAEHLRDAPTYDFARPPHEGTLLYEYWRMGASGAEWRLRAGQVLAHLGQP